MEGSGESQDCTINIRHDTVPAEQPAARPLLVGDVQRLIANEKFVQRVAGLVHRSYTDADAARYDDWLTDVLMALVARLPRMEI